MLIDSILLYVRGGWSVLVDELYTMTHFIKVILLGKNNGEIKDINTEGGLMVHQLQIAWMSIKFLKLCLSNVYTFTLKLGFKLQLWKNLRKCKPKFVVPKPYFASKNLWKNHEQKMKHITILPDISDKLSESTNHVEYSRWGCGTPAPSPRTFPALSDNALHQWTSRATALGIFWRTMVKNTVAYSEPCQAPKMEDFVKIVNGF